MIPCTTYAHFPHTPRITLMPPLQASYHLMFCLLWTYRNCYSILLTPYLLPCTCQYCQWTPYTFIGICIPMPLIKSKHILLLINIPIQDRAHQITIHQVFTLDIPHGNYSAHYDIQHKILWSHQGCHNGIGTIQHTI